MARRNRYMTAFEDDPFFNYDPRLSLTGGSPYITQRKGSRSKRADRELVDRDRFRGSRDMMMMMSDPFESMESMVRNFQNLMRNTSQSVASYGNEDDPDSRFYSKSSVMSYSNIGDGQPKIYQATSATRQLPGGLRETRKAMRDSEAGLEKMGMGRHIRDRGSMITRQKNLRTGDFDEDKEFYNMDEHELPQFNDEWMEKSRKLYSSMNGIGQHRQRGCHKVLDNGGRPKHRNLLAVESAPPRESKHRNSRH